MKPSLMEHLVCPACRAALDLTVTAFDRGEILEGVLACRECAHVYPVARGVPRFVGGSAYAASFAYQWNRFRSVQLDSMNGTRESERALRAATGWGPEDYLGRLVLDAGTGAGRYAEVAARHGATVFGVDLSEAVEAAYQNVGRHPRVHLVQADIFALPFRPGTFDLAFSIGVLHHTPDPGGAFERVARMVRPGGKLAVYVYAHPGAVRVFPDAIRTVTRRLPPWMMSGLAALAVPLYPAYRLPLLGPLLQVVAPISMHRDWRFRWLDTFDWYTPRYQWKHTHPEVFDWFRACGFREVEITGDPIRMRGTLAPAEAAPARAPLEVAAERAAGESAFREEALA